MLNNLEKASRQELLEEINRLRNENLPQPAEQESEEEPFQFDEDFFNSLMNMGGFDLNSVMTQFIDGMLHNIPTPAYCLNLDGEVVSFNKPFLKFCEIHDEETELIKLEDIFNMETLYEEQKTNQEVFEKNEFLSYETVFQMKNESLKDASVSKSVFHNFDGTTVGLITVINDVTAKKAAERALVESERKMRKLNSTKDKLFSIISHDLKNPVLAVMSFANMLKNDFESFDREDIYNFVSDITNSAEQTYTLLENLLQWSLSQRSEIKLNFSNQRLAFVIDETFELMEAAAKNKSVSLITKVPKDMALVFDKDTVFTILRNLVSNAVKFSNNNGKIVVSAKTYETFAEVIVEDDGIGVKQEDLFKLFNLDADTSTIGDSIEKGTGLGLILCKEFVELNKGSIRAESEYGVGSRFIFTLPRNV